MIVKRLAHLLFGLFIVVNYTSSWAAFPDDLDDVVFIEEVIRPGLTQFMRSMPQTATLTVDISGRNPLGGQNVFLNNSHRNIWPGILGCCNANAWLIVNVDGTWYAGTWEFMRVGQVVKSTLAMVGPGHLRFPPLNRFQPRVGDVYGFMMSGITRNGIDSRNNNIAERSDIFLYRFGVGPATPADIGIEPEPDPVPELDMMMPIYDLLLEEEAESDPNSGAVIPAIDVLL